MIGTANLAQQRFGKAQKIRHSPWLLLTVTALSLFFFGNGRPGAVTITIAQEKSVSIERVTRPLIRVPTHLTLEEARVIIEAAMSAAGADGCGTTTPTASCSIFVTTGRSLNRALGPQPQ